MEGPERRTRRPRLRPIDWDAAPGIRQFWWILPPITFALVTVGVMRLVERVAPGTETFVAVTDELFAVEPGAVVSIDNWDGDITVVPGETGTVRVTVERRTEAISEAEAIVAVQRDVLRIHREGNTVDLRIVRAVDVIAAESRTVIRAEVPPGTTVLARSLRGDIRVDRIAGSVTAVAAQGDIQVDLPPGIAFSYDVVSEDFASGFSLEIDDDGTTGGVVGEDPQIRLVLVTNAADGRVSLRKRS
ncbi:MAG: hypothetical protein ACKVVT_01140 [Dehalococcoidia bacterium]